MTGLYIFAALVVLAAFAAILMENAPEGYEDRTGFHFGKKP